ncbi:MAG: hypothetical protein F2681_12155 [Actinobacteria bacterium]|uniref:Unannotated protein n=1 Tax=freshwater metagenome TaxID=449393 RepID=A0A6J6XUZ5_9ZZZZ|nr:hypothetical protein [Actinomycetota bacterium]MSW79213.1 hypothetical protein [Actinomycetota bacterium]MSX54981.1 hypothetical protein [Actinomycetota bacterium]MSX91908.1 hypothetical protein [Actinomycetota bacterium]MSZ83881.1 hypothetical protein [Actinomycetota bacterium]
MSGTALVTLRYRPAADVLSGQVSFGDLAGATTETVEESRDADTALVWSHNRLRSFQIVFAAARASVGPLPLPHSLFPAIETLIITALHAVDGVHDPLVRLRAKAEATTELPLQSLTRDHAPKLSSHRQALDRRSATQLSHALCQLADAVHTRVPADDVVEALHTDHLARLLRELSSTIQHQHGSTSPGTTAAARVAARAGDTFSVGELATLEQTLTALDDPASWPSASTSLHHLLLGMQPPQPHR